MTQVLRVPAPAKLNLMLHITGRRADGYHLLQTVFQFIDLLDWLDFELLADGSIRRDHGNTEVPAEQDILLGAARLLQVSWRSTCVALGFPQGRRLMQTRRFYSYR